MEFRYIVRQYINGRTDWYELAGFASESDANAFSEDYPFDVEVVDTRTLELANQH